MKTKGYKTKRNNKTRRPKGGLGPQMASNDALVQRHEIEEYTLFLKVSSDVTDETIHEAFNDIIGHNSVERIVRPYDHPRFAYIHMKDPRHDIVHEVNYYAFLSILQPLFGTDASMAILTRRDGTWGYEEARLYGPGGTNRFEREYLTPRNGHSFFVKTHVE